MKTKLLCILHRSPPAHGAAKVGDFIASSKLLEENFELRFITIKSSETIGDIGKISLKKIYYVLELYFKVLIALIIFQPDKIYFTASIRGVAFYRDLLISSLWKMYKLFKPVEIFYHYHTKGVNSFVLTSKRNLKLTRFFIKDATIILLSPLLKSDFDAVNTYKHILFLPNGVRDTLINSNFEYYVDNKYKNVKTIEVLYLSNMIKSKGYFEVLKLATTQTKENIHFHFAGGWQNNEDEKEFHHYIKHNKLTHCVTYHGFVNGDEKKKLFEQTHLFVFPTRYPNEAFPLSLLEALSYGVPSVSTNEGSIPFILDSESGVILDDINQLENAFASAITTLINTGTSKHCRRKFQKYFTQEKFESNLVNLLRNKNV